ncbi:hypothetical protein DT73_15885 [Mangrovibacter sp. MFB070]|uniref:type II secretion system minor pseudopilin GspJ n=1 Tax=Mangrovibacter sp. MFB070 TaxID=1224318 RepID=UPI0004D8FCA5|nr:type II secretion system minor pseudopilin GspJ [Mangrovibacter sp. MFB070]KEA52368.1 hypothetical protein DT73_15885 [Mangrovibacter sp. MFB070]
MTTQSSRGFTLLEMLLAITVFAVMSAAGLAILQGTLRAGQQVQQATGDITAWQRLMWRLDQDFSQAVARPRLPGSGTAGSAGDFRLQRDSETDNGSHIVTLLRSNKLNPGGRFPRASMEWVQWRISSGALVRISWPYGAEQPNPVTQIVLPEVSSFHLRVFNGAQWQPNWLSANTVPQAVEITVSGPRFSQLQRVIPIVEGV